MVPGWNLFLWPIFAIILDFIWSNHFIPVLGVFPFPNFSIPYFVDIADWANSMPIMAFLQAVAFVLAILCDGKYLK